MTENPRPIAILGAAGGTGRHLVAELDRRGVAVRAIVRRPEQASAFRDARVADFTDVDQLIQAIAGTSALHFIPPVFNTLEPLFAANIIVAAESAGVSRICYHSVLHAPTPAMPHHLRKSQVELMLRESSLVWTILQPAMYMQTCFTVLDQSASAYTPPYRLDAPFNPVDLSDLAEVAATILTEDGHEYATYELAGTQALTSIEIVEILRAAKGGDIAFRQAPTEAFASALAERRGFSDKQTAELIAMYRHYDGHGLPGNGRVLEMLLGRQSARFENIAQRYLASLNLGIATKQPGSA